MLTTVPSSPYTARQVQTLAPLRPHGHNSINCTNDPCFQFEGIYYINIQSITSCESIPYYINTYINSILYKYINTIYK